MTADHINVIDQQTEPYHGGLLITLTASYDGPYKSINLTLDMPRQFLVEKDLSGVTEAAQGIFDKWLAATKDLYSECETIELSPVERSDLEICQVCGGKFQGKVMNAHLREIHKLQPRSK